MDLSWNFPVCWFPYASSARRTLGQTVEVDPHAGKSRRVVPTGAIVDHTQLQGSARWVREEEAELLLTAEVGRDGKRANRRLRRPTLVCEGDPGTVDRTAHTAAEVV